MQNGEKVQTKRKLKKEAVDLKKLIASCPSLQDKSTEWMFTTAQQCLNLLSELKAYPGDMQLIWPKGESFKLKAKLSVDNLNLKITGSQDWFELEGDVASPSMVELVAKITSVKLFCSKRCCKTSIPISLGPMPSKGDKCPIKTK